MSFDYKNILIMGYGRSGQAVEEIVKKLPGVKYTIFDSDKKIKGGNYCYRLSKKIVSQYDLIVVSPGISVYNKIVTYAEKIGIKVIGELEFGYWFTESPIVAITGTNGKTTTTMLAGDILAKKYKSGTYGNIGTPLSLAYAEDKEYLVCEVSSFQLETTYMFKPYISVILNIAEDHIDRHKTFENYINSKLGLLKNCTEKSIVILNADDSLLMERTKHISVRKYYISMYEKVRGVYIKDGKIYSNIGKVEEVISLDEIPNLSSVVYDVLAAVLIGMLLKVGVENIVEAVKSFKVSRHRLEVIAESNGITYINDSKSTNVHSTMHALKNVANNVVLLLGGSDKDLNFAPIFEEYLGKIDCVVAFGKARNKVAKTANKYKVNYKVAKNFKDAVDIAFVQAKPGNIVLLSPACSSLDEFKSYTERGDEFVRLVKGRVNANM